MGIVFKETSKNTATLLFAILVGAVNTLVLYVYFLEATYYGLITFLLSTAFVLKPLMALGVNFSIVKFYSFYKDNQKERDKFLSMSLWQPLLIAIPVGVLVGVFYEHIVMSLSAKNVLVKQYTFLIFWIAIASAYFEIFYAWARVQLKSVFGNVLKELFVRIMATLLLFAVYLKWINSQQFIYGMAIAYGLQMLVMMLFAFKLYTPKITFQLPANYKEVIQYSLFIILAGSAATILLDIDKFMIPQKEAIEQVAFYAVAVYIGSVIEIPGRAMSQITQPLTAKALNEENSKGILELYQKTSINLTVISGIIFVLVNANIHDLYQLMPQKYTGGVWVVLMVSITKLYHMLLGNNGAIISNSSYYKILLPYGLLMATTVIVLNNYLIDWLGINGAALATLVVVLVFNTLKMWYVRSKFGIQPITSKTWIALAGIVFLTIFGIYICLPWHPLVNIAIKSIVLIGFYGVLVIKAALSPDLLLMYNSLKTRVKRF